MIPKYLRGYKEAFTQNPREVAMRWLRDAKCGSFLHYGLYAMDGIRDPDVAPGAEWVQCNNPDVNVYNNAGLPLMTFRTDKP